jgi:cytochrome c553
MNKTFLLLLLLLPLTAMANPFPKGNAAAGRKLHDAKCVACHQRLAGGDGSGIYTRIDRKIQTPKALLQRIAACNAQVNAGWFPEEEEHAAAFLNRQYYKFR